MSDEKIDASSIWLKYEASRENLSLEKLKLNGVNMLLPCVQK